MKPFSNRAMFHLFMEIKSSQNQRSLWVKLIKMTVEVDSQCRSGSVQCLRLNRLFGLCIERMDTWSKIVYIDTVGNVGNFLKL